MIERPLDRLNYYNGQRLEASDLKLEQEYHIRVRRWINRSLYLPGIARGLDIRAEKDSRFVIVSPGLALDVEGREILLLQEERIFVPGKPHNTANGSEAEVEGLYLTILYNEEAIEEERNGCIPKSTNGKKTGSRAAWGGPALVRAKPLFKWSDVLPYESSNETVLVRVALDKSCARVEKIDRNARVYVRPVGMGIHRTYALAGEKDIDPANSKKIYFHIQGRRPNAVTLYLRADKFSTLYYTELGKHSHPLNIVLEDTPLPQHQHSLDLRTDSEIGHAHRIWAQTSPYGGDLKVKEYGSLTTEEDHQGLTRARLLTPVEDAKTEKSVCNMFVESSQNHDHVIQEKSTGKLEGLPPAVTHTVTTKLTEEWGNGIHARAGSTLAYVSGVQVLVDGADYTQDLLANLGGWKEFGDGTGNHRLVTNGTGPLPLGRLLDFEEGEHVIELRVASGGGRIIYNLYVD